MTARVCGDLNALQDTYPYKYLKQNTCTTTYCITKGGLTLFHMCQALSSATFVAKNLA